MATGVGESHCDLIFLLLDFGRLNPISIVCHLTLAEILDSCSSHPSVTTHAWKRDADPRFQPLCRANRRPCRDKPNCGVPLFLCGLWHGSLKLQVESLAMQSWQAALWTWADPQVAISLALAEQLFGPGRACCYRPSFSCSRPLPALSVFSALGAVSLGPSRPGCAAHARRAPTSRGWSEALTSRAPILGPPPTLVPVSRSGCPFRVPVTSSSRAGLAPHLWCRGWGEGIWSCRESQIPECSFHPVALQTLFLTLLPFQTCPNPQTLPSYLYFLFSS